MPKRTIWTPERAKLFRELYPHNPDRQVAEALGMTLSAIRSRASNTHLLKAPGYRKEKPRAIRADELEFIKWTYFSSLTIAEIARLLGRGESTIQHQCKQLGLKGKPNSGCIKKGTRPPNFRKKMPGYAPGRMGETQFKKGQQPTNTLFDGAITIRYDHPKTRKGRAYKFIRVAKGKWTFYHRWLWEQHNGAVPPKHMITFKDGDTMNCVIDTPMHPLSMMYNGTIKNPKLLTWRE